MKIAHMIDTSLLGGAERMAISLANSLAEKGDHEVWLIITHVEGEGSKLLNQNVHKVVLGKRRFTDWKNFKQFLSLLRREQFDIVHAHTNSVYWALLARLFFYPGLRVIWHDHFGNRPHSGAVFNRFWKWCSRYLKAYIGISKPVMGWAQKHISLPASKLYFLPNFPVLDKPDQSRVIEFGKKAGNPTFLMLGNYRREKDHLNLLEAFQIVQKEMPGARLWLAGKAIDEGYKTEVMAAIKNHGLEHSVVDWGSVEDISSIMEAADIGVFASRFEGLPVSLLEFGLAGKPVVATAVGEIPTVLGQGQWGGLADPGKPTSLARQMIDAGADQRLQKKWALDFRHYVINNYNQLSATRQLEHIYLEAVKG